MSNFQLIDASAVAFDLTATDVSSTFGASTNGVIDSSNVNRNIYVGDGTATVSPLSLVVRIVLDGDEVAAWAALQNLRVAATGAVAIKRIATSEYRALQVGAGLSRITPVPIGHRLDAWTVTVTLLPLFPRWTTTDARTLAAYGSAVKT